MQQFHILRKLPGPPGPEGFKILRRADPTEAIGRGRSALDAVAQGFTDVAASIPKALAVVNERGPGAKAVARILGEPLGDPRDNSLFKVGESLSAEVREKLPTNPNFEGDFFTDVLPRGTGSMVGFLAGTAATGGTGVPALASAAVLGAATGAAQGFDDALANGANLDDAFQSFLLNGGLGLTEAAPISAALSRLDKATGGTVRRIFTEGAKGGIEELLQETVQSVGANLVASDVVGFDPNRPALQGVAPQAGAGFTIGAALSTLTSFIGGRRFKRGAQNVQTQSAQGPDPISASTGTAVDSGPAVEVTPPPPVTTPPQEPVAPPVAPDAADSPVAEPIDTFVPDIQIGTAEPSGTFVQPVTASATVGGFHITGRLSPNEAAAVQASPQTPSNTTAVTTPPRPELTASEKAVAFRKNNGPDAQFRVSFIAQEFRQKATPVSAAAAEPVSNSSRSFATSPDHFATGTIALKKGILPKLEQALKTRVDKGLRRTLTQQQMDRVLSGATDSDTPFLPIAVQEPRLDTSETRRGERPLVIGRIGDTFVATNAQLFDLLDREGLTLRGDPTQFTTTPTDTRLADKPLAIFRGDEMVGALMGIKINQTIVDNALDVEADQDTKSKTPRPVVTPGRIPRQPRRSKPRQVSPARKEVIATAKVLQRQTVDSLKELETEARAAEDRYREAVANKVDPLPPNPSETFTDLLIPSATAQGAKVRLKATSGAITALRERLDGGKAQRKFESRVPSTDETIPTDTETTARKALKAKRGDPLGTFEVTTQSGPPGENFIGLRVDAFEPGATASGKPITREGVIGPFLQALNIPIYQGRVKGKVLGFFRKPIEEVRIKIDGDLEVTAHEIAHLLDFRIPEIRRQWSPATNANAIFRQELKGVSYDETKTFEGFAEFVRLWMTQPGQAVARAPAFNQWWEGFLSRNELGAAIHRARRDMQAWFNQPAVARAKSKIGEPENIDEFMNTTGQRFRQHVVDDLEGIRQAELSLEGEIQPNGIYETARLSRSAGTIVEAAMKFGAPKAVVFDGQRRIALVDENGEPSVNLQRTERGNVPVRNTRAKPWGFSQLLKPVAGDLESFGLYAVGKRANFLNGQGRERLFTRGEIDGMLALATPERIKAFRDWNRFNKQIIDFAEQSGLIDPVGRAEWETDVFVPFWRVDTRQTGSRGKSGNVRVIRRLTGGTANIRDPISNMFQNTRLLIEAAIINQARRTVVKKITEKQGSARFLVKISKDNKAVWLSRDAIEREFKNNLEQAGALDIDTEIAVSRTFANLEPFLRFWLHGQSPRGDNVIAIMNGGQAEFYEVADPLLLRSLNSLPRVTSQNTITRILSATRRVAQLSVTASVDFMIRNFTRDQMMATVMSKTGFKPFVDAARGLRSRISEDAIYQEWLANGGGLGSFFTDEAAVSNNLRAFYGKHGIAYDTVVNTPRKFGLMVSKLLDASEIATRLGEFRRSLDQGDSPAHAAYLSREVSTDFAMRGDGRTLGLLYDTVMFLKAGVVGMDRVYRGFTSDPSGRMRAALLTGGIALASAALWAFNRGNPLFDDLEDWDRDTHWHFFIPKLDALKAWLETGRSPDFENGDLYAHFRMPKPWEIGGIGSIAERSLQGVIEQDPKQAGAILKVIRDQARFELIPAALAPLYEQATNRLIFFDRPIETQAQSELLPFARSSPFTSRTLRAAGEATRNNPRLFQFNPVRTEALLRGYFNTWAAYGLQLSDAVFFDDIPDLRADQYPGLKTFFRQEPARNTKSRTEFYDMLREATETRRTMRLMDKTHRPDIAGELEFTRQNLDFKQLTRANKELRGIGEDLKNIARSPSLEDTRKIALQMAREKRFRQKVGKIHASPDWNDIGALKRELTDLWITERNKFTREVVKDVKRQQAKDHGRKLQ